MNQQPPGYPPTKKGMSTFSGVLLALIVFFVVLPIGGVITCVVCAQVRADATGRARAAEVPQVSPPSPPSQPQAPLGLSGTASVANFTKDTRLDECDDFTVTLSPELDAGPDALSKIIDALTEKEQKTKSTLGLSKIARSCAGQFRANPVLATCTAHQDVKNDAGRGFSVDIVGRYYNLDTLSSDDTYMKDCLDMNGDWQAAEKDSDEYREAVRKRARREVESLQRKLGNSAP